MWKRFLAKLMAVVLCVSALSLQETQTLTVSAKTGTRNKMPSADFETQESKNWFSNMVDAFKDDIKKEQLYWAGVIAGGVASSINDGHIMEGVLLGSVLQKDAAYYQQPTKIYDKVAGSYKDDVSSASTSSPGYYYYQGSTTNNTSSTTNNYKVFNDMSNYTTNNYNYQWYNPITNNYNYTNNYQYSYEYNTYYYNQTINNYQYDYYYIDNSTHVTYYIVQTDTSTNQQEDYVYDMYYQLPDGRNSYTLQEADVWGSYLLYNSSRYNLVAEDDGKTLGLWHFDGDLEDSSYWKNNVGSSTALQYSNGAFGSGKLISKNVKLPLNNCSFDKSSSFTLEWREYHVSLTDDYKSGDVNYYFENYILLDGYHYCSAGWRYGEFAHYALTYDGSNYSFYENGVMLPVYTFSGSSLKSNTWPAGINFTNDYIQILYGNSLYQDLTYVKSYAPNHVNSIVDEMRLSKGVLYTENFAPPSQPFDTNKVLVLPEDVADNTILFYTGYDYDSYRLGGVRPTYPVDGYIYVYVEDDVVQSTQQYQTDKWVEIESFLYKDGELINLKDYSLADHKVTEPEDPNPDEGGSSNEGPGTGDDPSGDEEGGFSWSSLIEGITKLFGSILNLVGKLVGAFADLVNGLFDALGIFTDFSDGYSNFLTAAFPFIPPEVWNLVKAGILAMIIVGVIKLIRG